ncbi:MAG TPA: tRNA (adenosine(37)-N6)-threonylcarbamoyltransferase complex dimerization subunit type 1 TsaB [Acidimicrobiales bacterium]|nr:tRNA (adenosine(37)-N6)-threonylcarbamoyltransferase complex dimerization subunit type 1 TsaB [Acidimicrobiales bacterium]
MLILGISTSTQQVGCAIGGHEGVLASVQSARGKRHAETLVPAIDVLRRQAQVDLSELGCVAVDLGPGLFTGLRVGIATAKALAHALRVPMIGVPSLDLVAFPVRWTPRLIVAAIDARRGELFVATYRQVPGGIQRIGDYRVSSPKDLATDLLANRDDVLLVGDGAMRYADEFEDLASVELADQGLAYPSPASLVQLAHAQALREQFVNSWDLEPLYLRAPDAAINWSTRDGVVKADPEGAAGLLDGTLGEAADTTGDE